MAQLGLGMEQNFTEALDWYYKAAAQGNPQRARKYRLPVSTRFGRGDRLRRSANLVLQSGRARKFQCGKSAWIYESVRDSGVPADFAQALAWYHTAANQGNHTAIEKFESLVRTAAGSGCRTLASSKRRSSAGRRSSVSATDTDREPATTGQRVGVGCAHGREFGRIEWGLSECRGAQRNEVAQRSRHVPRGSCAFANGTGRLGSACRLEWLRAVSRFTRIACGKRRIAASIPRFRRAAPLLRTATEKICRGCLGL